MSDELITALSIARQFVPNGTEAAERVDTAMRAALEAQIAAVAPAVDAPIVQFGCHCDLDDGQTPDACVIDQGHRDWCTRAARIDRKEDCDMWKPIALSVNPASDPKPAVDAQPVAIYQTRWAYPETVWGDVTKDVYDRYETFGYVERRTVYASAQLTVNSGDKR